MPLQIRRGTQAERGAMTVPLASGELLYVTDDQRLYIGNGTTLGGVQITGYTDGDAKDAAAAIFTGGTHSGINFSYNTVANTMNVTVDLSSYSGAITATAFKGTLTADDSTILIDAVDGKINLDGTVKGNIVPFANEAYDLGTASYRFRDLYLSGSSIKLGSATITSTGTAVNLPAGSTVGGQPIAYPTSESLVVDIQGSVFGDDSTVIINAITNEITTGALVLSGDNIKNAPGQNVIIGDTDNRNNLIVYGYSSNPAIQINGELSGSAGLTQLGPFLRLASTKGTFDSPTVLGVGDLLGQIQLNGYVNGGGSGATTADLVAIRAVVDTAGDLVSTFAKAKLQIYVANQDDPLNSKFLEFDVNGVFSVPAMKVGVYTDTPDTRPTGSKGMIIFNDTTGKFQGHNGTTWVDLN